MKAKMVRLNKKGQAALEMAIFGSLILLVFGTLLSYLQNLNDRQYIQMETFRRALAKGCNYGLDSGTAGASVQLTLMQDRRNVAVGGGFRKGNPSSVNTSSSVFWAVPKTGQSPDNLIVYRINEDESPPLPRGTQVEGTISNTDTAFAETLEKAETPEQILTRRASELSETVTHAVLGEGDAPVWQVTQGLYKDTDGQYRYSSQAAGAIKPVESERTWRTDFNE